MNAQRSARAAVAAALVFCTGCAASPRPSPPAPVAADAAAARRAVVALLDHGAAAWNRGDLAGFVSDYAFDATFVTRDSVIHGRPAIQARYAPRFAPGGVRDSLYFQDIEVDVLAPYALNAIAYYVLQRGDSVTARGPTSLVMRRVGGRWFIVHDHSS
ncbi:MAG: hypothetical protein B7Z72_13880 [Gemmatimonadetes bacterium 21-71-4]|nr:MAG: hypothetical protein B7Z72_13880 [Gemmatimonadetes bacterium 21-71-4]